MNWKSFLLWLQVFRLPSLKAAQVQLQQLCWQQCELVSTKYAWEADPLQDPTAGGKANTFCLVFVLTSKTLQGLETTEELCDLSKFMWKPWKGERSSLLLCFLILLGVFLKTLGKVSFCVTTLSYPPRNEERKEKIVFLLSPECERWTDTSAVILNPRANKILNSYINQETR